MHFATLLLIAFLAQPATSSPTSAATSHPADEIDWPKIAADLDRAVAELERRRASAGNAIEAEASCLELLSAAAHHAAAAGRPLTMLEPRLAALESDRAGPALRAEMDYWRLRIDLARIGIGPTTQPGTAARIRRIDEFIRAHPQSRRTIGLVAESLAEARSLGDAVTPRRWVEQLERSFPLDATTVALRGADRLARARGEPFMPAWKFADGSPVDWEKLRGRAALVLFAAAWDADSRELLGALANWPELTDRAAPRVIFVSLDRQRGDAGALLAETRLAARLVCDEQGWSTAAVDEWGVRRIPTLLLLDASGRLVEAFDATRLADRDALRRAWQAADRAVEPGRPRGYNPPG